MLNIPLRWWPPLTGSEELIPEPLGLSPHPYARASSLTVHDRLINYIITEKQTNLLVHGALSLSIRLPFSVQERRRSMGRDHALAQAICPSYSSFDTSRTTRDYLQRSSHKATQQAITAINPPRRQQTPVGRNWMSLHKAISEQSGLSRAIYRVGRSVDAWVSAMLFRSYRPFSGLDWMRFRWVAKYFVYKLGSCAQLFPILWLMPGYLKSSIFFGLEWCGSSPERLCFPGHPLSRANRYLCFSTYIVPWLLQRSVILLPGVL